MDGVDYKKTVNIAAFVFIVLQILLFPMIQTLPTDISAISSYVAIVLVAVFALVTIRGDRDGHVIRLGVLFTLFADLFLIIYERMLEGVLCFIAVQACYFVYLFIREERRKVRLCNVYVRVLLMAALTMLSIVILKDKVDALTLASVIYYANLVSNVIFAFVRYGEEKLFAYGLLLFAMCDLCIGLDVLFSDYLKSEVLSAVFRFPYANVPWIFYQPSQALIAMRLYQKIKT